MTTPNDITTFNDISENHSTWIIKYCSTNFDNPLFLVWYTDIDENSTDRLLTYKNGRIFGSNSLTTLKQTLSLEIKNLVEFENLNHWLESFNELEIVEYCTYDLNSVTNNIAKNSFDIKTVEDFANFINLYCDFVNQDESNKHLQVYVDNELIKETWDYFYNFIFWPRFNVKEKFAVWDRPQLEIDAKELLTKLKKIIKTFDDNIKQTEKAIC